MPLPLAAPKFRLRTTLVLPFVLQIVAAVGLVGYLSFRNGQKAVSDLAIQLSTQVTNRVSQQLHSYLAIPRQANEINKQAIELGMLDPLDIDTTGRFFWKQMQLFEHLSYINFGGQDGTFVGVGREDHGLLYTERMRPSDRFRYNRYALDSQGNLTQQLANEPYPFQADQWYQSAIRAGKPTWSPIYQWTDRPDVISISSSYPIYDANRRLLGVVGVDFILTQISEFLRTLNISPTGKVFVMERNGMIVASSSQELPYRHVDGKVARLNSLQSQEPLIRDTATVLRDRFDSFSQITQPQLPQLLSLPLSQSRAFVSVTPWQDQLGLDWLVVVIIPEADFMGQIEANTINTLWLCGAAFVVAIGIGIFTSRWVSRPIRRMSYAAEAMAQGQISQSVESSHLVELDRLAAAFNRMAVTLQDSFNALHQSEARNQAILHAMPDLILRLRDDGTYLDIQPAKGVDLVAPEEQQIGKRIQEFLPPELASQYLNIVHQAIASGETEEFEHQLRVGDRLGDYEVRVEKSGVNEAIVIVRDITERKRSESQRQQAEAQLLASEERFRSLVSNIPGALYRCQADDEWTMAYLTDAIQTIAGYPASHFINNQVRSYASIIHPDDRDLVEVIVSHAMVIQESFTLEYRILHQDGSVRWVHEQGRGLFDPDGNPIHVDGAIFDITERKQAERSLRRSEATNRALVEAIPDLLVRVNRDGHYITNAFGANRLRDIAGGSASLAGTSVWDSLPPLQAEQRMQAIRAALDTGNLQVYEQELTIDGQTIYEEVRVMVMSDEEALIMVRDISARKRAEEALRLANEELEQRVEQRTAELRQEKERSEQLLLNVLPAEIAERLKQSDVSPAEHFEEASILFADIVGFTSLATHLEPMQLVDSLNQIFSAFDQLTEKYGLEKIKTIGDAYMVVGGLPVHKDDHVLAIAEMALDMQTHMKDLNSMLGNSLQLRIGINTGPVIAGVIGIKKFIYDLWGDAVNIASRMESQGKPGHIQVTENTYDHLKNHYWLESRGSIDVKGRGEMNTYWLLGRR